VPVSDDLGFLLEAAAHGDDRAARRFVEATITSLSRLCHVLGSGDDVDDLVQETYLKAFSAAQAQRPTGSVLPWLLTIGRRTCADAVRRRVRQRRTHEAVVSLRPRAHTAAHTYVGDVIDSVSADRREAFVLTQFVGLSYDEAASVLDCPVGTIRSRVARARRDLLAAVNADASAEISDRTA
jgi:RNA polymerase sigma-70 factor, ECF subfamily